MSESNQFVAIDVTSTDIGTTNARLYLVGQKAGALGAIAEPDPGNPDKLRLSPATAIIERLVVKAGGPPTANDSESGLVDLTLASAIDIPGALVASDGSRLRTESELNDELKELTADLERFFLTAVEEAQRRLHSLEVRIGAEAEKAIFLKVTPFGPGGAFAGAHAKLSLWGIVKQAGRLRIAAKISVELSAYAHVKIPPLTRTLVLSCLFEAAGDARLRVAADDFNVSLPEFTLPSFDLPSLNLPLSLWTGKPWQGASRAFERLGLSVKVDVAQLAAPDPSDEAKLALRVRAGNKGIDWAVVKGTFDPTKDWDAADFATAKLAAFNVTIDLKRSPDDANGPKITISDLQLADKDGAPIVRGSAQVQPGTIDLPDGRKRFGPIELSWKGVRITPKVDGFDLEGGGSEAANMTLRCEASFDRLMIRLPDDPEAMLVISGRIELTPSGARILALDLVQPFPIALVSKAMSGISRSAGAIATLIVDFGKATAEQVKRLLDIVARIAAAAGRAALFVTELAGEVIEGLADIATKALIGVAELVGEALKALAGLVESAAAVFALEVRIATDPFALRQILVTLRNDTPTETRSINVLGFQFAIAGGWQPGLLVDLANQPGAYLIASRRTDGAGDQDRIASLSTDLWLKRKGPNTDTSAPLRDAAKENGERADKPLLEVGLNLKDAGQGAAQIVVLAGLRRGRGVFFHRLRGEAQDLDFPAPLPAGVKVKTILGAFSLQPISDEHFDLKVKFEKDRILPLLGMGEPGKEQTPQGPSPPSFLDKLRNSLSNVVWVKHSDASASIKKRLATLDLILGLRAAGLETEITLKAGLSLDSFEVTFDASDSFPIISKRIEERALGLTWVVEQICMDERLQDKPVEMFHLGFSGGQSGFELNKAKARMELRFEGLSSDGKGVAFCVETFKIGPGGLDLVALVKDEPVRLNGVDVPFRFNSGRLEIRGGRLVSATIGGRGSLPPELIGDADCHVALTFGESPGEGIVLQSGKVELDKKGEPIVCHASRFTLTITDLDISFVKDNGYHFFYLVTGSLRFTPKSGEFESGLLQYLDGVEMNLERTPLSADPRVLVKHISFQKSLNPKKTFNLFNLFTFELRGFGYHPASSKFSGAPAAVNISGQIKFVEIGDVMQPSIDFHGLWIAPPADGKALPRIKADGLGIDLNLKGSIRVRGSVIAVDPESSTVEGAELAPKDYNTYGFLGQGEFDIPGWGNLGASLGFLELERKDRPGERRKSFYFYAEKKKMAIEIPAVIWTFYLREAGFGLGFRYTLEALNAADRATSIPKLIQALDDVSKRQGDLHKFSAWRPEVEGDRVTLALKGAIQAYPAQKTWDQASEENAQNPFFFDLVAAIRSDFTLFMGLRGWIGANYVDYLNDHEGMRSAPGLRGYLYISAPHKRLLARMIADSKGYIGQRIPALKKGDGGAEPPLRRALRAVDWSATLFIKPGLFHYELGWPDQLAVRLVDQPNMRVTVRGGMIFRAADDGLLWGYNVEADAFFRFGGELQIGPIGIAAEASLVARLVARVICYLSWRFEGSLIYGLVSLDASLNVSIRAWLEVDLGFRKFTIRIGFRYSLQLSAAIEMVISTDGVGARVRARVAVSAFGCTLSVSVGFTIGAGALEEARSRVQRFMAMSITSEEPDTAPAVASQSGDSRLEADATHAEAPARAEEPVVTPNPEPALKDKPAIKRSHLGTPIRQTNFWLVLHTAGIDTENRAAPEGYAYALLIPMEPDAQRSAFYAAPRSFVVANEGEGAKLGERDETKTVHWLLHNIEGLSDRLKGIKKWQPGTASDVGGFRDLAFTQKDGASTIEVTARWQAGVPAETPNSAFTLAHLFDECFLSDTEWKTDPEQPEGYRITASWTEPAPRIYDAAIPVVGTSDQERLSKRDIAQRQRAADAAQDPVVDGVHQARSTVLSMFLDQFVILTQEGRSKELSAHVTDLGLVFYGPSEQLQLLEQLSISTLDPAVSPDPSRGAITVFNPKSSWFNDQDPELAADRQQVAIEGIKLDWRLQIPFASKELTSAQRDPEQFLSHYEIRRTIEGREFTPNVTRVKPASTIGGWSKQTGMVTLLRPDWQFVDDLSDLEPMIRRALLPTSDDALAREAAIAWAERFGSEGAVTVTYSVTPVDIAGTRGLPKSFVIDIERPQPPIQAAEAELRFVVTRMGANDTEPYSSDERPNRHLGVVLALRDNSFIPKDDPKPITIGGKEVKIIRYYHLVADPDAIHPSGHYGTDGLTERRLMPASGFGPTADELVWILNSEGFIKHERANRAGDTPIEALEPDQETLAKFPFWRRLAGDTGITRVDTWLAPKQVPPLKTKEREPGCAPGGTDDKLFLDRLWTDGVGRRIATRFALETVQEIRSGDGKQLLSRSFSKRVPVAIEVRVEPVPGSLAEIGLMRPEMFEWPVHLEMPPHEAEVRAESGFARFRMPRVDRAVGLEQLVASQQAADDPTERPASAVALVRDAQRRVLTQVMLAARPQLRVDSPVKLHPIHETSVAGYDLHELDVDDLARLDTSPTRAFERDAQTWRRSRRVARIERVSPEMARLQPDNNRDWIGWQAHYPSEAWRLANRGNGREKQAKPIRAPWYTAAESTISFAERTPRLRFFPAAMESVIQDLMAKGRPTKLIATLVVAVGSRAEKTLVSAAGDLPTALRMFRPRLYTLSTIEGEIGANLASETDPGELTIARRPDDGQPNVELRPRDIRAALLKLGWGPTNEDAKPAWLKLARACWQDPIALDGLSLSLVGKFQPKFTPVDTGTTTQPLTLSGPRHPLIEEILGELEYASRPGGSGASQDPVLYRRYVVNIQSVEPSDAKDLAGFMSATVAEKDPYGWATLQQLGLATTITLFDRDEDCFVSADKLVARIDHAVTRAAERYRDSIGDRFVCQPLVDVLLKPGRDRVPGPFDAILNDGNVEDEVGGLRLEDDGLAIAQISLRPMPMSARQYWSFKLAGEIRQVEFSNETPYALDVVRIVDQSRVLVPANGSVTMVLPPRAMVGTNGAKQDSFWLRSVAYTGSAKPILKANEQALELTPITTPADVSPSPFEVFEVVTSQAWIDMAVPPAPAGLKAVYAAFDSLRQNLWLSQPNFAWPDIDRTVAPKATHYKDVMGTYLTWSQRFLDHGAVAKDGPPLPFALAAPIKAQPWHLATDRDGYVALSFLHSDRWAHARAYAVRPTSRYDNLALGTGYYTDPQDSERLVTPRLLEPDAVTFKRPLGYALAVSPRTERIEPPVILGSSLTKTKSAWELIVARHGEEALAFSNRPLFARLGTEGTAISFVREYREPTWPDRLRKAIDGMPPVANIYPQRMAVIPEPLPGHAVEIDGPALGELAARHASLWKGADVWRIYQLPPHYRVTALAIARAGIVVSNVVSAVQDAMPRRPLNPLEAGANPKPEEVLGEPRVAVIRPKDGAAALLCLVDLRLVSHADLTESAAKVWITGKKNDIAWWPDPDVTYTLLRHGRQDDSDFEDEDASVRLVSHVHVGSDDATPEPIVVRSRGTRFEAAPSADGIAVGQPKVVVTSSGEASTFRLGLALTPRPDGPAGKAQFARVEGRDPDDPAREAFNMAAANFARIDIEYEIKVGVAFDEGVTLAFVSGALEAAAILMDQFATSFEGYEPADDGKAMQKMLVGFATQFGADRAALPSTEPPVDEWEALWRALSRSRVATVGLRQKLAKELTEVESSIWVEIALTGDQLLVVFDLPADAEIAGTETSGHPVATPHEGTVWRLCRARLLGAARGFKIRAVDTRNAIEKVDPPPGGKPAWKTPGEIEIDVKKLPKWV